MHQVNPIDAPIKVISAVVDTTFNGQLLSHINHPFMLTVPVSTTRFRRDKCPTLILVHFQPLKKEDSKVVTARLENSLLRTIWLVRGRTKIKLHAHIKSATMSWVLCIDRRHVLSRHWLALMTSPCQIWNSNWRVSNVGQLRSALPAYLPGNWRLS